MIIAKGSLFIIRAPAPAMVRSLAILHTIKTKKNQRKRQVEKAAAVEKQPGYMADNILRMCKIFHN